MRHIPLAGMAFGVILAGCEAASPIGFEPRLAQLAERYAVPLKGSCELAIQPAEPIGPGVIRQVDVGSCRLTHLGTSTLVSDKIIDLVAGTQTTQIAITAANGDVLHGSGAGTNALIAPGRVAFRVELAFTGGTGRFAGASGTAVSEGEADLLAGRSTLTLTGWVTY